MKARILEFRKASDFRLFLELDHNKRRPRFLRKVRYSWDFDVLRNPFFREGFFKPLILEVGSVPVARVIASIHNGGARLTYFAVSSDLQKSEAQKVGKCILEQAVLWLKKSSIQKIEFGSGSGFTQRSLEANFVTLNEEVILKKFCELGYSKRVLLTSEMNTLDQDSLKSSFLKMKENHKFSVQLKRRSDYQKPLSVRLVNYLECTCYEIKLADTVIGSMEVFAHSGKEANQTFSYFTKLNLDRRHLLSPEVENACFGFLVQNQAKWPGGMLVY
jgi:hypothetical protein